MKGKKIWEYGVDGYFSAVLYEVEPGILCLVPAGRISMILLRVLFQFLREYKKNYGEITLLVDNSFIQSVSSSSRAYAVKVIANDSPIERTYTFGQNYFMGNIVSLMASIMSREKDHFEIFNTGEQALAWFSGLRLAKAL